MQKHVQLETACSVRNLLSVSLTASKKVVFVQWSNFKVFYMKTKNYVIIVIVSGSVNKVLLNTCAVERGRGTRVDKHCSVTLEIEMHLI